MSDLKNIIRKMENNANRAFNGQVFCPEEVLQDLNRASTILAVIRKYVSINELDGVTLADILRESGIDIPPE
jgi:hypothetical protein